MVPSHGHRPQATGHRETFPKALLLCKGSLQGLVAKARCTTVCVGSALVNEVGQERVTVRELVKLCGQLFLQLGAWEVVEEVGEEEREEVGEEEESTP